MDILSPEQYLISKAKAAQARDSYEAKAWIITAQTLFPKVFLIQYEAFLQEKSEMNLEAAAKCFSYIVLTFQHQNQPLLWTEVTKLTAALKNGNGLATRASVMTEEQEFYLKMFQHIPYEVQHKILLLTANHLESSMDHCRLILMLMKRSTQAIPQHARCLLETLIQGSPSNVQQYREMLINEALPVILQSPPELPSNLLNVVVGIAIEHYVGLIYCRVDDEKYVAECWAKVFETLEMCGRLLKWEKFVSFNRNLAKDVYWQRLMQIVASSSSSRSVDNKQIFYTSIVVFIYSLQEYISNVSRKEKGDRRMEFLLVESLRDLTAVLPKRRHSDTFGQEAIKIIVAEPCRQETPNCLIAAAHTWQLLNSNELLQMESSQLLVSLPIADWITRFISDLAVYLGRPDDFQAILKTAAVREGLDKDIKLLSLAVLQNNLAIQSVGPLIVSIAKELAQNYSGPEAPQGEYLKELAVPSNGRNLILLPMTKRAILQYCVLILISKLNSRIQNLLLEPSDAVFGYLLVLLQLNWPTQGSPLALQIFNLITAKRSFTFLPFSKYIIQTDLIEEFAYMWSPQGGEVNLELTSCTKTRNYGTRRADKGVKDEFKQVMRDQILRSHEDMDYLIIMFILQEHSQMFTELR